MELKFKAWYKEDKQMIDWIALAASAWNTFRGKTPLSLIFDILVTRKDEFEVLPFIGVSDVNGIEIHLKQIIKGRYFVQRSLDPDAEPNIIHFEGVVEFSEGCYYVKGKDGQCVFSFNYQDYEIEVLGNIYENADLLK